MFVIMLISGAVLLLAFAALFYFQAYTLRQQRWSEAWKDIQDHPWGHGLGTETTSLMLAHACDVLGSGRIIGVDLSHAPVDPLVRAHPRITLLEGDACASVDRVRELIGAHERVMVIDDEPIPVET